MEEDFRHEAARYRRMQGEQLSILRATKDFHERQQTRLLADFYGRLADEYEAKANKQAAQRSEELGPNGSDTS